MSEQMLFHGRTMATDDEQWPLFIEMLCQALGDPDKSRCCHDHCHATAIVSALGFDVGSSLAFFKEHGGYCDCEIMLNIYAADV